MSPYLNHVYTTIIIFLGLISSVFIIDSSLTGLNQRKVNHHVKLASQTIGKWGNFTDTHALQKSYFLFEMEGDFKDVTVSFKKMPELKYKYNYQYEKTRQLPNVLYLKRRMEKSAFALNLTTRLMADPSRKVPRPIMAQRCITFKRRMRVWSDDS